MKRLLLLFFVLLVGCSKTCPLECGLTSHDLLTGSNVQQRTFLDANGSKNMEVIIFHEPNVKLVVKEAVYEDHKKNSK